MHELNVNDIGGMKPHPVLVDEADEKLLREIIASPWWSRFHTRRAEAVLAVARGGRLCQLTKELGYSVASIRRACRKFQKEGVAGLLTQRPRTGRPRRHFTK